MMRRTLFALLCGLLGPIAMAGTIQRVTVRSVGTGFTLQQAILNGLTNAVRQVDDVVIDSEQLSQTAHLSLSNGNNSAYLTSHLYMSRVAAATRGRVLGFVVQSYHHSTRSLLGRLAALSHKNRPAKPEVWTAQLQVTVAKFALSENEKRMRIVVFPPKAEGGVYSVFGTAVSAHRVAYGLADRIQNILIGSHDFTVLNRRTTPEIQAELHRIRSGAAPEQDYALLGQSLVADYVLVGAMRHFHYELIRRPGLTGHHVYVTAEGAIEVSYKLINVPTRQVVWSGIGRARFSRFSPFGGAPSAPAVLDDALAQISRHIGQAVVHYLYPIRILSLQGSQYVIGAGRGTVRAGQVYEVMREGAAITNPDTHQSLGYAQIYCCHLRIDRVQQRLAYGSLLPPARTLDGFAPNAYVLGHVVATSSRRKKRAAAAGMSALQNMIRAQDQAAQHIQ